MADYFSMSDVQQNLTTGGPVQYHDVCPRIEPWRAAVAHILVARLWAGRTGFFSLQSAIFLFVTKSKPAVDPTQPPVQWYRGYFVRCNAASRRTNHSPPSSVEVKNSWSYTSTSTYVFITWCLIKYKGKLYLYLNSLFIFYSCAFLSFTSTPHPQKSRGPPTFFEWGQLGGYCSLKQATYAFTTKRKLRF